ncbi:hypothetical protein [Pseudomonas helleri]|uniref:hypothetical protein n=1 Tax=Pseudomonas helleri TaxID=1608996 RepID=UPI003FD2489D
MALKIDVEFKGISIAGAYVVVMMSGVSEDKTEQFFTALYRVSPGQDIFYSSSYTSPYDMEGANPFVQAYEYLKTRSEFNGYVDC